MTTTILITLLKERGVILDGSALVLGDEVELQFEDGQFGVAVDDTLQCIINGNYFPIVDGKVVIERKQFLKIASGNKMYKISVVDLGDPVGRKRWECTMLGLIVGKYETFVYPHEGELITRLGETERGLYNTNIELDKCRAEIKKLNQKLEDLMEGYDLV